jgi:hypothetical protein
MKSVLFVMLIVGMCSCTAKAQPSPFQRVDVPDSIYLRLEHSYNKGRESANAGRNVFNLLNRKDLVFKDGIFSFKGQGPHFPRKIFIFNKGALFVFENEGAFNPRGVLYEFINSIDLLQLTDKQIVKYSKVISEYLQFEEGLTYGAEIK